MQCTGDGQNNGKSRKYRNKIICVSCTERTLVVSIFLYSFVCLRLVVLVSVHYRLCLVTVRVEVLHNGRTCQISWSICNRKWPLHWVIQSSRLQGYNDIHKWEDIS